MSTKRDRVVAALVRAVGYRDEEGTPPEPQKTPPKSQPPLGVKKSLQEMADLVDVTPTKDWYDASDYSSPESAFDFVVGRHAEKLKMDPKELWEHVKGEPWWDQFAGASESFMGMEYPDADWWGGKKE